MSWSEYWTGLKKALTVLVGKLCAGKSTAMAQMCGIAARQGKPAVFASWEASPDITSPMVGNPLVVTPYILGWDLSELERWFEAQSIGAGLVVAVDYVQLISGAREKGSLLPLRRLAQDRGYNC